MSSVCCVLTEPGGAESLTLSEAEPVQGSTFVSSAHFPLGSKTSLIQTVTCQGRKEEGQSPSYGNTFLLFQLSCKQKYHKCASTQAKAFDDADKIAHA